MLCWSARPRYWRQTVSAEHIRVDVPLAYTSPTKCPRLYYQNFYINSGTDSWLIVNRLIRSLNRLLGAKTEKNWNISDPKTSQLDWGPVWLGASVTVQEAWIGDWSATAAAFWDRGGDRRFVHRHPPCSCSLRSFPFFILLGFSRRSVGPLYFPTHLLKVSVAKTRESFLALQCELRPRLFAWLQCPPPPLPRAARAEFSAACLPCGASIPPTTIVLRQLVRYGGRTKRWEGVH